MNITQEQGKRLIKLARASIESYFSGKEPSLEDYKEFSENRGAFVTLMENGELRGCIGFPEPIYPLNKAVDFAAQEAAFGDDRFFQLTEEELPKVKIEVTVLTVPEEINVSLPDEYLDKIKIGEDGLIIKGRYQSGLLLPQVFVEYKCDAKKALEMLCEKAGLEIDAWKDLNNKISKFQGQIFKEE